MIRGNSLTFGECQWLGSTNPYLVNLADTEPYDNTQSSNIILNINLATKLYYSTQSSNTKCFAIITKQKLFSHFSKMLLEFSYPKYWC